MVANRRNSNHLKGVIAEHGQSLPKTTTHYGKVKETAKLAPEIHNLFLDRAVSFNAVNYIWNPLKMGDCINLANAFPPNKIFFNQNIEHKILQLTFCFFLLIGL